MLLNKITTAMYDNRKKMMNSMHTKWETDLTKLLMEKPYSDENEILLVKLVTFTRIKSPGHIEYESNTKICPATFKNCGNYIKWRICDSFNTLNDNLIIQTPVEKGAGLGHTDFENIGEIDSIYIVMAYRIAHKKQLKQRYNVCAICGNSTENKISTETLSEAKTVIAALKANGISAEINKII